MRRLSSPLILLLTVSACGGESADPGVDAGSLPDAAVPVDGGLERDGGVVRDGGAAASTVAINELGCSGDLPFVELTNRGPAPARLDELRVTDSALDRGQPVATGALAPGAFVVVELLEGNRVRCGDETLRLLEGEQLVDEATPPELPDGVTWARLPDGTGAFARGEPTPGAANVAFGTSSAPIFAPFEDPIVIELSVPRPAQEALQTDPYSFVSATFSGLGDEPIEVGIRIKGRIGSFRGCPFDCGQKSGLKLDFNRFVRGQSWRGLEKLTLNNQVQDPARTHEWLAYELFRRQGLPVPRVGYANVRVNGESWGLYLVLEGQDDQFLDRHFPSTQAIYEGSYGQDLFPGTAFDFELDEGDEERLPLRRLIDTLNAAPRGGVFEALAPILDWDEVLGVMAVEVFIGHWDGYTPTRNNYFLHADDAGVFRLIPWGTDQTFDARLSPLHDLQGLLLQRCLEDMACVTRWADKLVAVADDVRAFPLRSRVLALAEHLQPFHEADPRREYGPHPLSDFAHASANFVEERIASFHELLVCAEPDRDGDGFRCALDCDEDDPALHVGPPESCPDGVGNGRDDDCNGFVDEAPECPDCRELGAYRFCREGRTYDDAAAACAAAGMRLVVIDGPRKQAEVDAAALALFGKVDFWIGLTDTSTEGLFLWADGRSLADTGFANWGGGEPNDYFEGEDCAHARPDGLWNDLSCGAALAYLCERPAAR
jgi:hypothetical protein